MTIISPRERWRGELLYMVKKTVVIIDIWRYGISVGPRLRDVQNRHDANHSDR